MTAQRPPLGLAARGFEVEYQRGTIPRDEGGVDSTMARGQSSGRRGRRDNARVKEIPDKKNGESKERDGDLCL